MSEQEIIVNEGASGAAAQGEEQAREGVLRDELDRSRAELEKLRAELEAQRTAGEIDAALAGSEIVDLDVGRLLVRRAMAETPGTGATEAVAQLRRRKPHLFSQRPTHAGAMGARQAGGGRDALTDLAARARGTGDRRALLDYLRARRTEN